MKIKKILASACAFLMTCSFGLIACNNDPVDPSGGGGANKAVYDASIKLNASDDAYYTRFTESWRSVKQQGWAISNSASDAARDRSLALFDYLYSKDGNKLMSYGPDNYIAGTMEYNGKEVPKLSEQALKELNDPNGGAGSYTNYYRRFLGATFPIGYIKEQGMEYQTVHDQGKTGLDNILAAVRVGAMDHLLVSNGEYTPSNETSSISLTNKVTLRLAVMYDKDAFITFNYKNPGYQNGGFNYQFGAIKPVWAELSSRLNFGIDDVAMTKSKATSIKSLWENWGKTNPKEYDVIVADADKIVESGVGNNGVFVNLLDHLDKMPNYKHFLEKNPAIKNMILAGDEKMYYAPYFDGYDDIERMFMMRTDWVEKLLDGETAPSLDTAATIDTHYTPFMPASMANKKFPIVTGTASNPALGEVTKSYDKNIITIQNELTVKNGKNLTEALRNYIDSTYGNAYGTNRSKLFTGLNAAYDPDELVALLRCVETNPILLTGRTTDNDVIAFYPRGNTADRVMDVFRLMSIWGVRGLDTRNLFMYVDKDGILQDSRLDEEAIEGLEKLNQLYKEKLILQNFGSSTAADGANNISYPGTDFRGKLNAQNRGFMTYDYNQTTTIANNLSTGVKVNGQTENETIPGFNLTPVLPPYTDWGFTAKPVKTDFRFMTVPTANPLTNNQKIAVENFKNLASNFDISSDNGKDKDSFSAWHTAVMSGFGSETKEQFFYKVNNTWSGKANNTIQNAAFQVYKKKMA